MASSESVHLSLKYFFDFFQKLAFGFPLVCVCVCVCVCVFLQSHTARDQRSNTHTAVQMSIVPAEKHNRTCNGFNGYNGNCIGFNGNYNGVYWYVMDSIGGILNPIGKMPKTHYKKEFCNGFTGKS